jgi:imidazolonepropionase-like amidohydrolase
VDWIKVYANAGAGSRLTDDGYIESPPNWTAAEFEAIVDEAHAKGHPVAAHATSDTGVSMALAAGVDTIEHGYSIRPHVAALMADRGVYLCPTLMPTDHVAEHRSHERGHIWRDAVAVQERSFRNCLEAGVKIAFGTDAGCFAWTERNQAEEFAYLVRFGMNGMDAIRSATIVAAEMLGSKTIGQLREGATADIIAVPRDPSQDVRQLEQVDFVMHAGKIIKLPGE